jgi:hypothetical protein
MGIISQWDLYHNWWNLGQGLPASFQRFTRLSQPPVPVRLESASSAWGSVLSDAGANARLDCRGEWVGALDAVDQRLLSDARNNTGPSSLVETPGSFPLIDPGTPCADTDGDGMPDEWESLYGLDPANADDAWTDTDGDGYWNVEEYLNGTAP